MNQNSKLKIKNYSRNLFKKTIYILAFLSTFLIAEGAFADYYAQGTLKSENLVGGAEVSSINSFTATSTIPAGTSVSVQFSQDREIFYSSTGTKGGWDALTTGVDTVDLSALAWSDALFYKIKLETTDPAATPVVGEVKVDYDGTVAPEPTGEEYLPEGIVVSADLLSGANSVLGNPAYFAYNISFMPSGTEVAVQFSQDGVNWYSADGTLWGWTDLSKGEFLDRETALSLETLNWESATDFYYKLKLTTNDIHWSPLVSDAGLLKPNEVVMGGSGTKGADPVAYWKFDEGFGDTAHNSSGDENHGTLIPGSTGGNTTATLMWDKGGKFGGAMEFDGVDDYMDCGNDSNTQFDGGNYDFSVSVWIKPNSVSTKDRDIIGRWGNGYTTQSWILKIESDDASIKWGYGKDSSTYSVAKSPSASVATGNWYHLVGIKNGNIMNLYINGKLSATDNSQNGTIYDTASNLVIGATTDASSQFYGQIDEVKIFDYALTPSQVKVEYNGGSVLSLGGRTATGNSNGTIVTGDKVKYCVPGDTAVCTAPVLELDFDEKTGTIAYDKSGNGNNGTLTGGPSWVRGKFGSALEFDGADDYVKSGSDITSGSVYTLEGWFKYSGNSNIGNILFRGTSNNCSYEPVISLDSSTDTLSAGISGCSGSGSIGSGTVNKNQWNHVSVVVNSPTYERLFINGKQIAQVAKANNSSVVYRLLAGAGNQANGTTTSMNSFFNGLVDQVSLFNYARTPAQIAWDYNRGKPAGEWRMDEDVSGDAQTLADSSGNSNHATTVDGANNTGMDCTVAGKFNQACQLDGTDDYISVGDLNFSTNAVSFWAKQDYENNYFLDLDGGTHTITLSGGEVVATGFSSPTIYIDGVNTTTLPDNAWHHILVATATAIDVNNLNIGKVGTNYYQGLIENVKIYNYPLTLQQIKTDYNNGFAASFNGSSSQTAGSALLAPSGPVCGDGVVEGDEQCECGVDPYSGSVGDLSCVGVDVPGGCVSCEIVF